MKRHNPHSAVEAQHQFGSWLLELGIRKDQIVSHGWRTDDGWRHRHFTLTVSNVVAGAGPFDFDYSLGEAIADEQPRLTEVMAQYMRDALDVSSHDNWESWAGEFHTADELENQPWHWIKRHQETFDAMKAAATKMRQLMPCVDFDDASTGRWWELIEEAGW